MNEREKVADYLAGRVDWADGEESVLVTTAILESAVALLRAEPVGEPVGWSGPFPEGEAWIAVDLDGTLARYDEWVSASHVGEPIPQMVDRVKRWRSEGRNVAILTARVAHPVGGDESRAAIEAWCLEHLGEVLPITAQKDYGMVACWDDRTVQVVPNDGTPYVAPPAAPTEAQEPEREINPHTLGCRGLVCRDGTCSICVPPVSAAGEER